MNYTDVMNALKTASLFDLFRLGIAISHEVENPARIKAARLAFKVGDTVSFFDEAVNGLRLGVVVEKNIKYVSLRDEKDPFCMWKVPYCFLNISNVDANIHIQGQEKLSKNNLRVGDCVGFNRDGESIAGVITRLNYKTVSLVTANRNRWRVGYGCLYSIIDSDLAEQFAELKLIS